MAEEQPPLKVLIVGAGIGGLAAAIALRRQGHHVQIYEQSQMASEIGAAICVFPNADSVLRRLGVDVADCGANPNEQVRYLNAAGKVLNVTDLAKGAHRWQARTMLAHRAHLHDLLKQTALLPDGDGLPVVLHKGTRIHKVDADNAIVRLEDGSTVQGDVLVGADGVRSVTRAEVEPSTTPFKTNHSAFRFLITREKALADPKTRELASTHGSMDMWYAADRKIVMYPCDNNTTLNFVCVHPAELSNVAAGADYDTTGSKDKMLEIYKDFDPVLRAFLEKAEPGGIKVWPLYDMKQLPTFVRGRMALIGDAAHPFLPHLGQGGAQAIEDGVAIATMLSRGVDKSEVPERVKLYNEARYERGSRIQQLTRLAGGDAIKDDNSSAADFSVLDGMDQAIGHDEHHHSTHLLRQHEQKKRAVSRWPFSNGSRDATLSTSARCQTATITFKTSATLLRCLFPNDSYTFKTRDTVAYASFRLQSFQNVAFFGGHGYHTFGLYVHNVVYKRRDGSRVEGSFIPILFQDDAESILSSQHNVGLPILYSDIEVHSEKDRLSMKVGWRGTTWGHMKLDSLVNEKEKAGDKFKGEQLLMHKCVPSTETEDQSNPDADYATCLDSGSEHWEGSVERRQTSKSDASFEFNAHDGKRLPTLHHVISRLAELPVFEIVEASVVNTTGASGMGTAIRIE